MAPPAHVWPTKLGLPGETGYSTYSAPSDLGRRPANWVARCDIGALIDDAQNVYTVYAVEVNKYGKDGYKRWSKMIFQGLPKKKRDPDIPEGVFGVVALPVLVERSIILATTSGHAVSLAQEDGAVKWTTHFGVCNLDGCSVGACGNTVVIPGREQPQTDMDSNNNTIFALDATTGKILWKYKVQVVILTCSPVVLRDVVLFQSQPATVECLHLKDGTVKWQKKEEICPATTGGVGVSEKLGMAFVASNRKGRKMWNFPFGGNGVVRAYKLADGASVWEQPFDLEANTIPSVAPVGPKGQYLVILGLGANPGPALPEEQRQGDCWLSRIVALDARSGDLVWKYGLPCQYGHGPAIKSPKGPGFRAIATSGAACGADGSVYISSQIGASFVLDGATGKRKSVLRTGEVASSVPVIGPGMVLVITYTTMVSMASCWQTDGAIAPGQIIRPLAKPLDETGFTHFWPCKQGTDLTQPCMAEVCAPTELTEPTWTFQFEDPSITKWYKREQGEFTHKTPIIDSQGNIYIETHGSFIWIVRPDGKLRGFVRLGFSPGNPALHGRSLYVAEGNGWCYSVDVETLKVNWSTHYATNGTSDSWNVTVCDPPGVVLVVGDNDPPTKLTALRTSNGEKLWTFPIPAPTYNFLPTVWVDEDMFAFCDSGGGMYCLKISDGSLIWEDRNDENKPSFSTGASVSGPTGLIYHTYNKSQVLAPRRRGHPCGGVGVVRAWARDDGKVRWSREFQDLEANNAPMLVERADGGTILVVPLGSNADESPDQEPWHWVGALMGLDGATGETIWRWNPPDWCWPGAKGPRSSESGENYNPDSWSNPPVLGADGTMYCQWHDGTIYAFDPITGEKKSQWTLPDCGESGIPVIGPGFLACPGGLGLKVFRDLKIEAEWREEAAAAGDTRAFELKDTPAIGDGYAPATGDYWGEIKVFEGGDGAISDEMWDGLTKQSEAVHQYLLDQQKAEREAKAAAKAAKAKAKAAPARPSWVVVGGKASGGIMVKKGKELKSAELGRLATGATIEEVELDADRLQFKKLTGEGPDSGWVSLAFKGAPLVEKKK